MEGRPVDRPVLTLEDGSTFRKMLQWRGGQLTARSFYDRNGVRRAKTLQWRGGQLTARSTRPSSAFQKMDELQWRGGQLTARSRGLISNPAKL